MKKQIISAAVLCALVSGSALAAEQGPWLVRARAVQLNSANGDSTGLGLSINDKTIPEVDITYFFDKNLAAELVLTVPQKHTLSSNGTAIGTVKHLPPTLTAQYHFDAGSFQPYVGAGVNYTHFSDFTVTPAVAAALSPSISKDSFGLALQVGVDIPLSNNLSLNFDVKKVSIATDVYSFGTKAGTFKVNPLLVGVGLGWRF